MDLTLLVVIASVFAAAIHAYIFVLETLRWEAPATRRVFRTSPESAAATKDLAANQGVYNLLLGIAAIVGAVLLGVGARDAGLAVALVACGIMLGAALYLVIINPRLLRAAVVQGLAPLVAVVSATLTSLT